MRFFSSCITGLFLCSFWVTSALAQTGSGELALDQPAINPVITGPTDIAVGRTVVLDASASTGVTDTAEYRWFRSGVAQPISRSVEAVYTPLEAESVIVRLVIRDIINGIPTEVEKQHVLTVYDRKIVLIADGTIPLEKIDNHRIQAEQQDVFLRVLQPEETGIPLGDEDSLSTVIAEGSDAFIGAESIIVWSQGVSGLQAMLRALENDTDALNALKNQTIVLITDQSLAALERTARGPYSVLKPDRIVVTRKEAMNPLIALDDEQNLQSLLESRDIDHVILDETSIAVRPWNLLSSLVNYMLTHGVSSQTVILLLTLPLIATILAFLKQVVGVTTFGLYTPSVIALSFQALGWPIGVSFLLFIVITGYITRSIMKRWRLLYIPKVAIILTVVSFTLMVLLAIGAYFGLTLTGDTIFILLIMSTLSESFLNVKTEQGLISAMFGIGETILAALLCVFVVQWSLVQSATLAYPELILLTLPINIFLGRWTGLRLVEYFRFKEVFKHLQEE